MAHQTEIVVNGVVTEVTEFDHTAQEIDDGIDNLHTLTGGATTAQAALAALGAGVRPSLLDNAIFVGGGTDGNLPVNQTGFVSAGGAGAYTFDRWKIYAYNSGTVSLTEIGVNLNGQFDFGITLERSRIPDTPNLPITLSLLSSDALLLTTTGILQNDGQTEYIVCPFWNQIPANLSFIRRWESDNKDLFFVSAYMPINVTVVAAKLEIGTTQTLAYQDSDGAWHLLPQPDSDYATQLAKCQRYGMYGVGTRCAGYAINASTTATIFIPTPVPMRTVPAAEVVTTDNVITSYGGIIPIQSFFPVEIFPNGVLGDLTLADAVTSSCNVVTAAFKCNLKADL